MLIRALVFCGVHGRLVLPLGLFAGIAFPFAAEPMRGAIPWCIGTLLLLSVLRLFPNSVSVASSLSAKPWWVAGKLVFVAQLVLPVLVFFAGILLGVPGSWLLAATLVLAAPPISGSPNLVILLGGDGAFAMRWLMLGTAFLPLSCLPVLWLLFPEQPALSLLWPAFRLLFLILVAIGLAFFVIKIAAGLQREIHPQAIDGASAIVLAVMVVGLMSAVHEPDTTLVDVLWMLCLATGINVGSQVLGVLAGAAMRSSRARATALGVAMGNRNIALYLTALPAVQLESLLLFIACYQVPMYLTPLIGGVFYRRLD